MKGCDFCGGEGKVRLISVAGYEDVRTCPVCSGDGFIDATATPATEDADAAAQSLTTALMQAADALGKAQARIAALESENARLEEAEIRNFRWAYSLMIALAQKLLKEANAGAASGEWPNGQEWHEMVGSSHSMFFHQARDLAQISHDEFLAHVRDGKYPVDDLYERANDAIGGG